MIHFPSSTSGDLLKANLSVGHPNLGQSKDIALTICFWIFWSKLFIVCQGFESSGILSEPQLLGNWKIDSLRSVWVLWIRIDTSQPSLSLCPKCCSVISSSSTLLLLDGKHLSLHCPLLLISAIVVHLAIWAVSTSVCLEQ